MTTNTTDPSYVDPALINPRAIRLVEAFKDALARLRDEEGLTFDDLNAVTEVLQQIHAATGVPLAQVAMPLYSELFRGGQDGYTPAEKVNSPTFFAGSPRIGNPGTLPMRPDEPGVPLIVSGRVVDGNGQPLVGAKVDIYHAANNGDYSGMYDDGVPKFNLRGHQFTDDDGRYTFTTITPVAYADANVMTIEKAVEATAALGRSLYRPAHIHYEVHHPDLITPWRGEIYFKGDPVIPVDFVGAKLAGPALQADTTLHEDPKDIAEAGFEGPYRTMEFDFLLKTRTSPDTAPAKAVTAPPLPLPLPSIPPPLRPRPRPLELYRPPPPPPLRPLLPSPRPRGPHAISPRSPKPSTPSSPPPRPPKTANPPPPQPRWACRPASAPWTTSSAACSPAASTSSPPPPAPAAASSPPPLPAPPPSTTTCLSCTQPPA